ncbi:hypothetical protein KKG48_01175 [Patescibacteria group bacterium]|nr:hypothetical protein [Patescibacteria group bacterium]MCG2695131.1 hypothetical protein [Candidatus Parcubacteria bacterium]
MVIFQIGICNQRLNSLSRWDKKWLKADSILKVLRYWLQVRNQPKKISLRFFLSFFAPQIFKRKGKEFFLSWLSLERSPRQISKKFDGQVETTSRFGLFQTSDLVERKLWFEITFCSERKT